jgi:hypothetical protein
VHGKWTPAAFDGEWSPEWWAGSSAGCGDLDKLDQRRGQQVPSLR